MKKENANLDLPVFDSEDTNETSANNIIVPTADTAPGELISLLTNPSTDFFCSITDDGTRSSKIKIYNAIQAADDELANHIGEVLSIVNVVAYPIEVLNSDGEKMTILRTILIDTDGNAYTAGSIGITNSLSRIFSLIGSPFNGAWEKDPVKVKVRQQTTKNGNKVNYLELIE